MARCEFVSFKNKTEHITTAAAATASASTSADLCVCVCEIERDRQCIKTVLFFSFRRVNLLLGGIYSG